MVRPPRARAALYEIDGKWPRKFALRVMQNVFCVASIGCAASTLIVPVQNEVPESRTVTVYVPAVALTLIFNTIWIIYLIRKLEPLSNGIASILQFLFSVAFVVIGPYTSAVVAAAFQKAVPNSAPQRHAVIALVGCILVDMVGFSHIVLFLWACNDSLHGTKPRAKKLAQNADKKRTVEVKQMRISNPISVVKNPVPTSASEQALFDAKSLITGEKPVFINSEASRSSLSVSILEDQLQHPQISVREITVNALVSKPINTSPLIAGARSASGRASPLSTSLEFQQQYPRLSRDFKRPHGQRSSSGESQDSALRNLTALHSTPRLSFQEIQPTRPLLPTHSKNSSSTSSVPLRPSSLRTSISTPQLLMSSPHFSSDNLNTSSHQPYNPRNSACAPEVVPSSTELPYAPSHNSSTLSLRTSKTINHDDTIPQSFTMDQPFPTLGSPASYRGLDQATYRPGSSGGISPQALRDWNARRISESSSSTGGGTVAMRGSVEGALPDVLVKKLNEDPPGIGNGAKGKGGRMSALRNGSR